MYNIYLNISILAESPRTRIPTFLNLPNSRILAPRTPVPAPALMLPSVAVCKLWTNTFTGMRVQTYFLEWSSFYLVIRILGIHYMQYNYMDYVITHLHMVKIFSYTSDVASRSSLHFLQIWVPLCNNQFTSSWVKCVNMLQATCILIVALVMLRLWICAYLQTSMVHF